MRAPGRSRARDVLERLAAVADVGRHGSKVLDQAVAATLHQVPIDSVHDVARVTRFFYEAFSPATLDVQVIRPGQGDTEAGLRWRTLLDGIQTGVPALPAGAAVRIALARDALEADSTPFVRPHMVADVGHHARLSSSSVTTGRLLALLVRTLRPATAVEIGTAYGLGSLFIAEALRTTTGGQLHTMEISHPQVDVARRLLAPYEGTVQLATGDPADLLRDTVARLPGIQLVFHDGEHSKAAYVRDFHTLVDQMEPGGLLLLDDIRWEDPHSSDDPRTYEGWMEIARHPRVQAAAELGSRQGLLMVGASGPKEGSMRHG